MSAFPITGVIQDYAWGGTNFLASLLAHVNDNGSPKAEYWMGAHHKGPASILGEDMTLNQVIADAPESILGERVAGRFDRRLPFLFKVLDVKDMLSIQVHPNKAAAEEGYAREESDGPARTAPNRNYRDDNHKPELGVALTNFYLLHGFKSSKAIAAALTRVPGWEGLKAILERDGVKGLYRHVMEADQSEIDRLLQPLVDSLDEEDAYNRSQPEFWASRAVTQYTKGGHHDRGMFSIYWFNIVHLSPGEGIFQDAGIPHAYLEGVCLELMANSDNVLRGGLTPKHIDVPELLDKTKFDEVSPEALVPHPPEAGWSHYPTPAPDFDLSLAQIHESGAVEVDTTDGPCILMLLNGDLQSQAGDLTLNETARTVFVPAGEKLTLVAIKEATVYRAGVGSW